MLNIERARGEYKAKRNRSRELGVLTNFQSFFGKYKNILVLTIFRVRKDVMVFEQLDLL